MNRPQAIAREFDTKAPAYETDRLGPWYKAHGDRLLDVLSPEPGEVVLDIGCGTGYLLRRIGARWPHATGIGLDLAPKMVEEAKNKALAAGLNNVTFVHADWERLNESAQSLIAGRAAAYVICASTLHYFRQPRDAIEAMHAALAPGGKALVLERARERSPLTIAWDYAHRFLIRDNVRFYDTSALLDMLRDAGFRDVTVRLRIRRVRWQGKLYTNLALLEGTRA